MMKTILAASAAVLLASAAQAQTAKPVACHFIPGVTAPGEKDTVVLFKLKKGNVTTANVFGWPLEPTNARFSSEEHEKAGTCPTAPEQGVVNWIAKVNPDGTVRIAFASDQTDLKYRVNYESVVHTGELGDKTVVDLVK